MTLTKVTPAITGNYKTVAALVASTEPSRGTGAIWEAGGFRYTEVASGGDVANAAGVELIDLSKISALSLTHWASAPDGTVTPPLGNAGARYVVDSTKTGTASAGNHLSVDGLRIADGATVSKFWFGGTEGVYFVWPEGMMRQVYEVGGTVVIGVDDRAELVFDSALGDDWQAMAYWVSSNKSHNGSKLFKLIIEDGLHELDTFADFYDDFAMTGRTGPTLTQVNSATFGALVDGKRAVTIHLDVALPDRVVVNYCIGMQNIKGDGGAEILNGAHQVVTVASDRLSFTTLIQSFGVVPTAFTTPDNALTLSLTANQAVIPSACLRVKSGTTGGWDGTGREGFINAYGGETRIDFLGFSYNGIKSAHDILFARGGSVVMNDRVVIAGAGAKVLRTGYMGTMYVNRSYFGGGEFAEAFYQGVANDGLTMIRGCIGGFDADMISATINTRIFITASVMTSAERGLRSTYEGSNITVAGGTRLTHCNTALRPDAGVIEVSATTEVFNNITPLSFTKSGRLAGSPVFSSNTDPLPASNVPILGGGWQKDLLLPITTKLPKVTATMNFPSIAAGSRAETSITYAGVAFGMLVHFTPATSVLAGESVVYEAFVSAADTIVLRATNVGTTTRDPVAKVFIFVAEVIT